MPTKGTRQCDQFGRPMFERIAGWKFAVQDEILDAVEKRVEVVWERVNGENVEVPREGEGEYKMR